MPDRKVNIGIIGYGNMGKAIADGIKGEYNVFIFDKDRTKTKKATGINIALNVKELVSNVDVVILAVKPQDFDDILDKIKTQVRKQLIISIAAGIETRYIEKELGKVRVVRVMPNLPAKIRRGMICVAKGKNATLSDLAISNYIFCKLGRVMKLQENMMDQDTAISGSGPGYYYNFCPPTYDKEKLVDFEKRYFITSLSASAQAIGFSKQQADLLAKITAKGSRDLLLEEKITPSQLKRQVTSKGGTTAEALKVFDKEGSKRPDKKTWIKAIKAAVKRARQLSHR